MTRLVKKALISTAALLLALCGAAKAHDWDDCNGWYQDHDWGEKGRYCELRTLELAPLGALQVDAAPNGGIKVVAGGDGEVRIQAKVSVWGRSERDARDQAAGIHIYTDGGRIRAESERRDNWSVSYRIHAPRQTDLDLESYNGGISVAGIEGYLQMETHNGGLSLDSLAGDVVARTRNGGVSVTLDGDRWDGRGLDVETRNGGVSVDVPAEYSAELETGTVNGRIRIDFPVVVRGEIGRKLTTTLGSGGAPVRIVTTNGGVRIDKI